MTSEICDTWYIPREGKPRWVLGILNGRVRYSTGGDSHHVCLQRTFRRWMKKSGAITAKEAAPTSLALGEGAQHG